MSGTIARRDRAQQRRDDVQRDADEHGQAAAEAVRQRADDELADARRRRACRSSVSWAPVAVVPRSRATSGSDGRYMSGGRSAGSAPTSTPSSRTTWRWGGTGRLRVRALTGETLDGAHGMPRCFEPIRPPTRMISISRRVSVAVTGTASVGGSRHAGPMCGRYASFREAQDLADAFALAEVAEDARLLPPSWNVAPTDGVRMVVERPERLDDGSHGEIPGRCAPRGGGWSRRGPRTRRSAAA